MTSLTHGRRMPGAATWRMLGFAGGAAVTAVALLVVWLVHLPPESAQPAGRSAPAGWARTPVSAPALADKLGVKITQVAVTGQGGLVDLRYRVLDPDRANAIHDPATPPAMVEDRSGVVVHQLYMDHEHSGPFRAGATYYLIFNNPGNLVHRGATVSVLLGDSQVDHVRVQ